MANIGLYLVGAAAAAFATVAALLLMTPSLHEGANRLRLLLNTMGVLVVVVCALGEIALLGWGFATEDNELVYISFMPFAAALLTCNFITRRHQTWWGILGFNDNRDRSRALWKETVNLWRGRDPDGQAAPPRMRSHRDADEERRSGLE